MAIPHNLYLVTPNDFRDEELSFLLPPAVTVHYSQARNQYFLLDRQEKVVTFPSRFLAKLQNNGTPSTTLRTYAYTLSQFIHWIADSPRFLGYGTEEKLFRLTRFDVEDWAASMRQGSRSPSTLNLHETVLRHLYDWGTSDDGGQVISVSPWPKKRIFPSPKNKTVQYVTCDEAIAVIAGFLNECERVAAHFLYDTGVRISELG